MLLEKLNEIIKKYEEKRDDAHHVYKRNQFLTEYKDRMNIYQEIIYDLLDVKEIIK